MDFFDKVKADFKEVPENKITVEECQRYLDYARLNNSSSSWSNVPDGMTAKLLKSFLVQGKFDSKSEGQIRHILSMASRYNEMLQLHKMYSDDVDTLNEKIKAAKAGEIDLAKDAETIEELEHKQEIAYAKMDAYWTALQLSYVPIRIYEGRLKVIDIDMIM